MKNPTYVLSILLVTIGILSSCSSYSEIESTFISNETEESTVKITESVLLTSTSESSNEDLSDVSSEQRNRNLEAYNNLPLYVKVQLIAEIVDYRAYPEGSKSLKERGYVIGYYVYSNTLILQVGSGVGVGHPVYLLGFDDELIVPQEGVVRVSASGYEIVSDMDLSGVSKGTLYGNYLKNKEAYDNSQEEVAERKEMREYFEFQKKEALKQLE